MNIKVGVSNRHVHLDKETFEFLFGNADFYSIKELSQDREFMSNLTVCIKTDKDIIEKVRVVGPLREKTQIEISKTDAYKLGINPPVRMSGDLNNSESAYLCYEDKTILIKSGVIIANRHIHCNPDEAKKYQLYDGKVLNVKVNSERGGILDKVIVKIKDNYKLELHIDTDEANAFFINNGDVVEIIGE